MQIPLQTISIGVFIVIGTAAQNLSGPTKVAPANTQVAPPKQNTGQSVVELATEIDFFQPREFALNREASRLPETEARRHRTAMAKLHALRIPVDVLKPLLRHDNARVRTIALAALFNHDDPSLLNHTLPLFEDSAKTYSRFEVLRTELFIPGIKKKVAILPEDLSPQTVGDVARSFAAHWMSAARYDADVTRKSLEAYLAEQKQAGFRSSWFLARMHRITSISTAIEDRPHEKKAEFDALKRMIDDYPQARRDWLLLFTFADTEFGAKAWRQHVGGDVAALDAAKRLGPDFLMKIVRNDVLAGDADLGNDPRCRDLRWATKDFVLRHARGLLKQERAAEILKLYEQDIRQQSLLLAACDLDRKNARTWLTKALRSEFRMADYYREPSYGSSRLAAGLVRFVEDDGISDAVAWYYNRKVPETFQASDSRDMFLLELESRPSPQTIPALKRIILDERFSTKVGRHSLWSLACAVNHHSKEQIAANEDLFYLHDETVQGMTANRTVRGALLQWAKVK